MGRKRQHNPYDWARALGGNPTAMSSYGSVGGYPGGFGDIKGVHDYYKKDPSSLFTMVQDDEGVETKNFGVASNTYKYGGAGNPNWQQGWYEPAYESAVRAPLRSQLGMSSGGWASGTKPGEIEGLVKPDQSVLMTLSEAFGGDMPEHIESELGSLPDYSGALQAGYNEPVVHREIAPGLATIGAQRKIAETRHDETMTGFETQEDEAKIAKDESMLDQRILRAQALSGRADEYEEARAGAATSGLSYSAPAERNVQTLKEENMAELGDIKRDEYKVQKGYEKEMDDIAGERRGEELAWAEDTGDYLGDLQSTFGEGRDKLQNDMSVMGSNLFNAWQEYGGLKDAEVTQDSRGLRVGRSRYGGGYKGRGKFFTERDMGTAAPEFDIAGDIGEQAQGLQSWIDTITASSLGALEETYTTEG